MAKELGLGDRLYQDDVEELFTDMLDEIYTSVKIGPHFYNTSHALANVDPIAYQQLFNDWLDQELEDDIIVLVVDEQTKEEHYFSKH